MQNLNNLFLELKTCTSASQPSSPAQSHRMPPRCIPDAPDATRCFPVAAQMLQMPPRCLPDAFQMRPDASRCVQDGSRCFHVPPRCFQIAEMSPDASQRLPKCFLDASRCFHMPPRCFQMPQMPPRCFPDAFQIASR